MAKITQPNLPADLPEDWNNSQYVSADGTVAGLTPKHGYNYLMQQVNASQKAVNTLAQQAQADLTSVEKQVGTLEQSVDGLEKGGFNATATRTGTTVAITGPEGAKAVTFLAPSNWVAGDTYTYNGQTITLTDLNGKPVRNCWKQGAPVSLSISGSTAYFAAGASGDFLPLEGGTMTGPAVGAPGAIATPQFRNVQYGTEALIPGVSPLPQGMLYITPEAGGAELTAQEILDKLKTVDGAGSGLDADLLDGKQASEFAQLGADGKIPAEQVPAIVGKKIESKEPQYVDSLVETRDDGSVYIQAEQVKIASNASNGLRHTVGIITDHADEISTISFVEPDMPITQAQKYVNIQGADPTRDRDFTTKKYVDTSFFAGLRDGSTKSYLQKSLVIGEFNNAESDHSIFMLGRGNRADGRVSFAVGNSNQLFGWGTNCIGSSNRSFLGFNSVVFLKMDRKSFIGENKKSNIIYTVNEIPSTVKPGQNISLQNYFVAGLGFASIFEVYPNEKKIVLDIEISDTWLSGDTNIAIFVGYSEVPTNNLTIGEQNLSFHNSAIIQGIGNSSNLDGQTVVGKYNDNSDSLKGLFVVGIGERNGGTINHSNGFRVDSTGKTYAKGAHSTTGADYAEYFEWSDGNPEKQDHRGRFVALDGGKIKLANSTDDFILGIVSGRPAVVGNDYAEEWNGKFLADIYGTPILSTYEVPAEYDEEGNLIREAYTYEWFTINPDYDPDTHYEPREQRAEWSAVGLMGQLVVTDDGTCQPGGYCLPGADGIATATEDKRGYRVMERKDATHVLVYVHGRIVL